jgi:hypothetical protein
MSTTVSRQAVTRRSPNLVRAGTLVGAALLAAIGWTVGGPLLGVPMQVRFGSNASVIDVTALGAALVAIVVGLFGWGLLGSLQRYTSKGRTIWTVIAVVVLVVSLAGPLTGVRTSTTVVLMCLHLLVGATLVAGFRYSTRAAVGS